MAFMLGDEILDLAGKSGRKTIAPDEMRRELVLGGPGAGVPVEGGGRDSVGDSHDGWAQDQQDAAMQREREREREREGTERAGTKWTERGPREKNGI